MQHHDFASILIQQCFNVVFPGGQKGFTYFGEGIMVGVEGLWGGLLSTDSL